MKKFVSVPFLVVVLAVAACGGDGGGTTAPPDTRPSVRFFNATTGMSGSGGFTANGTFATGSALTFGQATQTCSKFEAGPTTFAFGAANAGGTGLSGTALATLHGPSISTGGNYTVVAGGTATTATVFLLDNNISTAPGTNQAAVRFVNLVPSAANPFTVFSGTIGAGGTLMATNITVGAPTTFNTVTSGSNAFTVLHGHDIVLSGSAATLNLQGGTVNTVAIVPNASGGFQLINLPRC